MSVYLNSITFKNAIDLTPLNWALANVGEQIVIEHDISIKEYALSSTNNPWVFNNDDGYIVTAGQPWITGGDFSKFNVGNTINYFISGTSYYTLTIVEKLSNTEIRVGSNPAGWAPNTAGTTNIISLATPVTALSYKWNFIENDEATNYYSKVDGSIQIATINGLNPAGAGTNKPMAFLGTLPYQLGSIVVDEVSLVLTPVYSSNFKIRHTTRITPVMLAEQWDDIQADIKPSYFFNLACLKSVFFFEARYNLSDPNNIQTLESDTTLGNTGWFNENFNTGLTNYYSENLVYTNSVSGIVSPKAELSLNESLFSFDVRNTIDNPFVAGSTKLVLNFCKAPNDATEYQLNGRDLKHNFVWESALLTVQTTPTAINGDNYSDLKIRSLSNLKATFVRSSKITITGKLDFDQLGIDIFNESNEPRYMFWVSIQDHTKVGAVADRTNLLIDKAPFFFKSDFPNLITFNSSLLNHYTSDLANQVSTQNTFSEDELVAFSVATITPDPLVASVVLNKATFRIVAQNLINPLIKFTLESKTLQLPNDNIVSGYQYFDIKIPKNIRIPSTEIRKNIIAKRSTGLTYNLLYPYLNRWEYWEKLLNVNPYFFNTLLPNNGFNHDWVKYDVVSNWLLRFEVEISARVNNVPATYIDSYGYYTKNRNLVSSSISATIKTYDSVTLTQLVDSVPKNYILGYKNTLVKAEFISTGFTLDLRELVAVIGIEIFEEGGVTGKRRMSSLYPSDSDTWFIPLPGETKTKLTTSNGFHTATAECLVDFTKLNLGKAKYKLTCRLYGAFTQAANYLVSQDVYLIPTNPIDEETIVLTPKHIDCCDSDTWKVLADVNSNDALKNDINRVLWSFNKDVVSNAVISFVKSDGSVIALNSVSTYGTPYDYGFNINSLNEKMVGYEIEWKKVLTTLGEGSYQIKCVATTIFGSSSTQFYPGLFCLSQYTTARANGTVRIEYINNGLLGNTKNDEKQKDFGQINWCSQHRFDGYFVFKSSNLKEEDIVYQSGQRQYIESDQEPEYVLDLKPIPAFKHDILRVDILMADTKMVTDYNDRNFENYYKKKVINKSSYDPKIYPKKSKLASVLLTFIQEFNKHKKFRS